jgi:hypothetical protein
MSKKRVDSAAELSRELARLGDLAKDDFVEKAVKKLAFDGFTSLVVLTPFDTGFASSLWRVGVNVTQEGAIPSPSGGVYAPATYGNPSIELGDKVHLYNNTVYIGRLENGWSQQAPQGMVEPTYSRLLAMAQQVTSALSKEAIG